MELSALPRVVQIPLERLLLETDSPDGLGGLSSKPALKPQLVPVPPAMGIDDGTEQLNHPANIRHVPRIPSSSAAQLINACQACHAYKGLTMPKVLTAGSMLWPLWGPCSRSMSTHAVQYATHDASHVCAGLCSWQLQTSVVRRQTRLQGQLIAMQRPYFLQSHAARSTVTLCAYETMASCLGC